MSALSDYFGSLANKIRSKTGKSSTLSPVAMINEIDAVYEAGAESVPTPTAQSKSVSPTASSQTVTPDSGYDYLSQVTVSAVQTQEKTADAYQSYGSVKTILPDSGKYLSKVTIPMAFGGSISDFQAKTSPAGSSSVTLRSYNVSGTGLFLMASPDQISIATTSGGITSVMAPTQYKAGSAIMYVYIFKCTSGSGTINSWTNNPTASVDYLMAKIADL